MRKRLLLSVLALDITALLLGPGSGRSLASIDQTPAPGGAEVSTAAGHAVSAPVRDMPAADTVERFETVREHTLRSFSKTTATGRPTAGSTDPVTQSSATLALGTTAGLNIPGLGDGDYGFVPNSAPPDPVGATGATQYVQWVNDSWAVFDKATGAKVAGPIAGNALFANLGGGCAANNDGDPIVKYDQVANRWILTQFSVSTTPYLQCVAVSTSADATGSYYLYAFSYANFPDYPKLALWPDGYYITFNMFKGGQTFVGPMVCAYDRNAMLAGSGNVTQQCAQLSTSYSNLVASDLDGSIAPPAGSPNFLLRFGSNSLQLWKFHVDWANSANSYVSSPTSMATAAFAQACGGGTCIPQPGTNNQLDAIGDRLMYRVAYRHFADGHEALVASHSVAANGATGIRWYELNNPAGGTMAGGTPVIVQQSTYAPDSNYRWLPSIAMDKVGDIAVGYSVSNGSNLYPSIRYTGRAPGDPKNTLRAEGTMQAGGGSQTGTLTRWGDYSSLSVDPVDDCTFWYTNEYLKSSGTFNWSTRIASFRFPGCQ